MDLRNTAQILGTLRYSKSRMFNVIMMSPVLFLLFFFTTNYKSVQCFSITSTKYFTTSVISPDEPLDPLIFGFWKVSEESAEEVTYQAIKQGYRRLDCATDYGNEEGVGR